MRQPRQSESGQKSVILSFQIVNPAGLDVLSGVLDYIRERHPWNVRLILPPLKLTRSIVTSAEREGVSGILVNHPLSSDLGEVLCRSRIPLVALGNTDETLGSRRRNIAFLGADDRRIGIEAARHFTGLGRFRSFAFLPDTPASRWSRLRLRGYRGELMRSGRAVRVFSGLSPDSTLARSNEIMGWLRTLPRPAAVLLAGDYHACTVIETARKAGLAVPGDISVLGVDNNPICCESTRPRLSSVEPDFRREGYEGAKALDRMMEAKAPLTRPKIVRIPPRRIVTRDSTGETSLGTSLVDRALDYIAENVQAPLTAREIARHLGVSQTLLGLRFRQCERSGVYEAVLRVRLERVAALLRDTDTSIRVLAEQFGFASASHLSHLFKKKYGFPPSLARARQVSGTVS